MNEDKTMTRIPNIIIGVMLFSLVVTLLYANSVSMFENIGLNESQYVSADEKALFEDVNVVNDFKDEITGLANKAPGGAGSTLPEDSETTEGSLLKSGLAVVSSSGRLLYSVPRTLITKSGSYLGIDPLILGVASASLILIVLILLVSSIMRNKL